MTTIRKDHFANFVIQCQKNYSFPSIYAYKEGVGFDYLYWKDIHGQLGFKPLEIVPWDDFNELPVQITLAPGTPVSFKVVNEEGEPLPGVKVAPTRIPHDGEIRQYPYIPPPTLQSFLDTLGVADSCFGWTNEEGFATISFLPERFIMRAEYDVESPREGVLHPDGRRVNYCGYLGLTMKEKPEKQEMPTITLEKWEREWEREEWKPRHVIGTVKLPDGTPVPWVEVEIETSVYHYHSWIPSAFTDVNGEYETVPLYYDDKYHINVADNMIGIASPVLNVDVGDGDTKTRVDFVLEKGIRVHGTVYDVDGKPFIEPFRNVIHHLSSDFCVVFLEKKPKPEPDPFESPFLDDTERAALLWNERNEKRNGPSAYILDGEYEYLLPAVKGEYKILVVDRGGYGDDPQVNATPQEFSLNGDEEEYEVDLYLKERIPESNRY